MLGPRWIVEERPNLSVNETQFHNPRRLLLPPIFRLTRFGVFHPRCWCLLPIPKKPQGQSATPLDTFEAKWWSPPPTVRSLSPQRPGVCLAPCTNNRPSWPSGHFPDSCGRCSTPILPLKNSNGMLGAQGEPRMVSKHVQTLASGCSAKASVKSGCTDLNQKFDRVDAHMKELPRTLRVVQPWNSL